MWFEVLLCEDKIILHGDIYPGPNSCSPDLCGNHPAPPLPSPDIAVIGLYEYQQWIILCTIVFLVGQGKLGYVCENAVAAEYLYVRQPSRSPQPTTRPLQTTNRNNMSEPGECTQSI